MNNKQTSPRLKKKISIGHIIATIVVIFGSITMLFPFLWMISASFKTNTECYSATLNFFPKKIILDSYKEILTDKSFYKSIGYTIIIEVSVIVIGTLVSSLAAFAFSKLKMKFRKTAKNDNIYDIEATIYTLRESHKGIIIGKNGSMLKKIGTYARQDLENMLGTKVNLKIWVKVKEDWLNNDSIVKKFKLK